MAHLTVFSEDGLRCSRLSLSSCISWTSKIITKESPVEKHHLGKKHGVKLGPKICEKLQQKKWIYFSSSTVSNVFNNSIFRLNFSLNEATCDQLVTKKKLDQLLSKGSKGFLKHLASLAICTQHL